MTTRLMVLARELRVGDVVVTSMSDRVIAEVVPVAEGELLELRFVDRRAFRTRPTTEWMVAREEEA